MGQLELTNAVIPVTGEFTKKKMVIETVNCSHCDYVLGIVINAVNRVYESDKVCKHCGFVICEECWKKYCLNGERCEPLAMRIDFCLKHGRWPNKGEIGWQPKIFNAGGA